MWLIWAFLPLLGVGLVGLGSITVALVLDAQKRALPVSAADQALVVKADALRPFADREAPVAGQLKRFAYPGGRSELSYAYEDDAFLLQSKAIREESVLDAQLAARAAYSGFALGAQRMQASAELVELQGLGLGDTSRVAALQVDGATIGSVAVIRSGKWVTTLVVQGTWFRDVEHAQRVLEPSLRAVEGRIE